MFNHLHCHSMWSALDGFGSPSRWVNRLKELEMKAVAFTEHGNIDSSIKMSAACREAGIKYVAGCEFYICEKMDQKNPQTENRHICIYAMNKTGWKNILRMLSEANISGYHYKPRIDPACLLRHLDGIIVSTACLFSFLGTTWGKTLFAALVKKIPDRLFLELMPHNMSEQCAWNKRILGYSKEHGIPMIATNDCHYPLKSDAELQEVCLAINSGSTWDDPKRFKFGGNSFYLMSEEQMARAFEKFHSYMDQHTVKKILRNTQKLVDLCEDFKLEKIQPDLPLSPNIPIEELKKSGLTEDDYFRSLVFDGLHEKRKYFCQPVSVYKERVAEELELLIKKKFSRYFLIVIDILNFCRKEGIAVGPGRGSVGGCLVAWLTGITQVDPIKYKLLFARFLDPSRCLHPETKIILNGKPERIIDSNIGDTVINSKGEEDFIIRKKIFNISENVFRITIGEDHIICTADHKWFVVREDGKIVVKRTDEINFEKEKLIRYT